MEQNSPLPNPTPPAPDTDYKTKKWIVILLLIFFYPFGLIFMWVWMKSWSQTLKIVLTVLPLITLVILSFVSAILLVVINPKAQLEKAQQQASVPTLTPTPNPTADWETYVATDSSYTIHYPSSKLVRLNCPEEGLILQVRTSEDKDVKVIPYESCGRDGMFDIEVHESTTKQPTPVSNTDYKFTSENVTIAGKSATKYTMELLPTCYGFCSQGWDELIEIEHNGKYYYFYLSSEEDLTETFQQMLSSITFPISPPVASPSVSVCQLDAKICPDGSSVGRTGPNCEFAACPPFTNN